MTCYETLFVVKPTLTEEEIAAQIAKVKDVLAKEGAELVVITSYSIHYTKLYDDAFQNYLAYGIITQY